MRTLNEGKKADTKITVTFATVQYSNQEIRENGKL